ncbi:RNB-domain-containing protein [Heliocybe sulcata]|uniref:RNB-domain-containing protein n=1 Tax=Heliocybe sulcata TaxID=5364 RepID=A0A5C3MXF1_9AGAM|nr:RNB-domain-containing protein [Heliocybe sulcata]
MHRRTAQCIADLRLDILRNRAPSSLQCQRRNRSGTTASKKHSREKRAPERPQAQIQKADPAKLAAHWSRILLNAAAEGEDRPGWTRIPGRAREEAQLSAQVVGRFGGTEAIIAPVRQEHQVFMGPADEDGEVEVSEDYKNKYFRPGAFVVLRRNSQEVHGVVLERYTVRAVEMATSLTATGNVLVHYVEDVTHAVPDFIDTALAARCGTEDIPETKIAHSARVTVLKLIRQMKKALEGAQASVGRKMPSLHALLKSPEPDGWSEFTLDEAIKLVPKSPKCRDPVHAMAVHLALLNRASEFQIASTYEAPPMRFYARPQQHVDILEELSDMVRTMNEENNPIQRFASKAHKLIVASRKRSIASWTEPPTAQPMDHAIFDSTDLTILKFLRMCVRKVRKIQPDPFVIGLSAIIRQLGLYSDVAMDRGAEVILQELGILSPWESVEGEPRGMRIDYERTKGKDDQTLPLVKPKDLIAAPSSTATASEPMGPDDLYTSDPLESVRHDFGDLPVYVIDDAGAKELDDGLSVEPLPSEPGRAWVHCHIADPTSVLPPTHWIAAQARDRVFTTYHVTRTNPLLGELPQLPDLSLGAVSARGKPEPVMTFSFKTDMQGNMLDYKVRAGLVRNVKRISYDEVDHALNFQAVRPFFPFGEPDQPKTGLQSRPSVSEGDKQNLLLLQAVTDGLFEYARRSGVFLVNTGQVSVSTPSECPPSPRDMTTPVEFSGFPAVSYRVENFAVFTQGSRRIVSECMKAAGRVASRFGKERDIPLLRRSQGEPFGPSDEALEQLLDVRDERMMVTFTDMVRTGVAPATGRYMLEPARHWFVGAAADEGYVRVTSPLRRYHDLVAHWQIKHALLPSCPTFSRKFMEEEILKEVDHRAKTHMKAEKEHTFNWALRIIQRWQMDPRFARKPREFDPLENLTGEVQEIPKFSSYRGCSVLKVYVNELGFHGSVLNLRRRDTEYIIGETLPLRMERLELARASECVFTER